MVLLAVVVVAVAAAPGAVATEHSTLSVADASTAEGDTATVAVTLSAVPNGLSGFDVTVNLENSSSATFTDAHVNDAFQMEATEVADAEVRLKALDNADAIGPGDGPVKLGTVTVRADSAAGTELSIAVDDLDDHDGDAIDPATSAGQLSVDGESGDGSDSGGSDSDPGGSGPGDDSAGDDDGDDPGSDSDGDDSAGGDDSDSGESDDDTAETTTETTTDVGSDAGDETNGQSSNEESTDVGPTATDAGATEDASTTPTETTTPTEDEVDAGAQPPPSASGIDRPLALGVGAGALVLVVVFLRRF